MKTRLAVLFGLLVLISYGFTQRIVISPQAIVVNPLPDPNFTAEVFLDKDPSGNGNPTYTIGESVRIGVRVNQPSYIYLYDVKPNGQVTQILPNRFDELGSNNFLQAGETKFFPPVGARYTFTIDPPNGLSKVIVVASRQPLSTGRLASFDDGAALATSMIGEGGFAGVFGIVVSPIPQQDWVTDTALYYVGPRPTQAAYGTLAFSSNPRGAEVWIDSNFAGFTPGALSVRPGRHNVQFVLEGYEIVDQSLNVRPGQTTTVNANLTAAVRTGTANFTSDPTGTTVELNGTRIGTTPLGPLTLDEGVYEARFNSPGYEPRSRTFEVRANQNTIVSVTLPRGFGVLDLQANVGGAQVFVNGNFVGIVPNVTGRLLIPDLATGTHELTVVAPGYSTVAVEFRIRSGLTTSLQIQQVVR